MKQIEVFFALGALVGTDDHLFRAAARGDQADARFDETDVRFRGGVNPRAVQDHFAAPAEREPLRRHDHRFRCVLDSERRVLELAHHYVQVVPLLFLRGHQDQHEVRAGGKVHALIGDDHRVELGAQARETFVDHGEEVAADGVHLRMEFAADDAFAKIDQACAGIFLDLF